MIRFFSSRSQTEHHFEIALQKKREKKIGESRRDERAAT